MQVTKEFANRLVQQTIDKGATACEVIISDATEFSVQVRLDEVETLKESTSRGIGLRVLYEGRQASVSTSDFDEKALSNLIDEAIGLAKVTSVDDTAGLPPVAELAHEFPDLKLYDPQIAELPTDLKINLAKQAEKAALSFDPRITNSEGGNFDSSTGKMVLANSLGFAGEYSRSRCALSTVPVAVDAGQMQRDSWGDSKRFFSALENPESIGKRAAERTLKRLGARKVKTQDAPVVFDQMTARDLLGYIFSATSGDAVFRKASFLVGKLEEKVASDALTVIDDGTIESGLGSRPFDGEGLPIRRTVVIEKGVLRSYLLNTYTAKKLGLKSTGNASRGLTGAPHVGHNNFFIEPGTFTTEQIIGSVKNGLYLTDVFGFGVNTVNGDFSLGAAGTWIENGQLTFPVEEITVASNLKDMLMDIEMVGNDLDFRGTSAAPTLKVSRMIISGE
ncbi:MAG TPA: TldD/PmbA family protein [Blastocatellia bacterium]|nr:TldD/PmbA family protein [Blastocatellia bacterium]